MTIPSTSQPFSWQHLLVGAGGGLASVAMFYSAARGGMGLSMVLLPLVPLPSLIAGFGWGTTAAAVAAIISTVVLALVIAPAFAVGYAISLAVPVVGMSYLLSLVRYDADGTLRDWFSSGRMIMAVALYGAVVPVLLIALDGGSYAVMAPEFTRFFNTLSEQAPLESGWRAMSAARIQALVDVWVQLMPAVIGSYWTFFFAINTYLAGRVVRISGLLVRPWPDLHWLTLPPVLASALALVVVGIAIGGSPRVLGIGALGAFSVAFVLQGLSVIHAIAKQRQATWMISAVYAAMLIGGALAMPIVGIVGVAETLTQLRRRVVPIPPALPPGSI